MELIFARRDTRVRKPSTPRKCYYAGEPRMGADDRARI
jgi:hypothetical protein